jgi:alpha-1,3-rhamnosyl/mannosyltransferase
VALAETIKKSSIPIKIKVAGNQHEKILLGQAFSTGVVELLGYVPHKNLAKLMADAALLYYPSRYETFGMGAAEAMAAGLPVVTSRCTAIPEVVGDCGVYVDPENAGEVLDVIYSLLSDVNSLNDLRFQARKKSESYRWNSCVDRLNSVLTTRRF